MAVRLLDYAFRGDLRKVKRCLNSGVDVDACESSGNTALYHAVSRNQLNCVKFLLRSGADPNRINKEGFTPVNEACLKNNLKCLALLVRYGGSLEHLSADHKESAIVSAYIKHSTRVIKFIKLLRDEALTKDGRDLLELEADKKEKEGNKHNVQLPNSPGMEAVVPQISAAEFKTSHTKLFDKMPHMTLQSALWHTTPVTVKRFKGREDSRQRLMKEADMLSWLRHPRVALLMAVCLGPHPEHLCLVMERFELASLNHLLYKSQIEMNLPLRVHLLLDVAEGMIFLHNHFIVHGFLNSFSVLVSEKFRAKIGNLEFSQEDSKEKQENSISIHENWMAPEQLLHEPPNMAGDVYSFGVLMWEALARELPWSWLTTGNTIKQALCVYQMTLPMLELWPNYIQSIMTECFKDPDDRPSFCSVHEYLLAIKNSGEGLTSEVLDGAFSDWYVFQLETANVKARRRRATVQELFSRSSTCGPSEIYVMLRRSSSQGNGRSRSTSVKGGLRDVLKMFSNRAQNSPREEDIERFGYQIAERLASARNMRRISRNYTRASWAKEVALARALEGDIERVQRNAEKATSAKKKKESSRRGRRYSVFNQESFEKILFTSSKYQKKNWSKVLHGMQKLKNSMKGFKGKVNEELTEYGRQPLTDEDGISEHSVHVGCEETDAATEMNTGEDQSESQASLALQALWEKDRATLAQNKSFSEKDTSQDKLHLTGNTDCPSPVYGQSVTTRRTSLTQEAAKTGCDVTSSVTKEGSVNKIKGALDCEGEILQEGVYAEPYSSRRNSRANCDTKSFSKNEVRTKSKTHCGGFVISKSLEGTPTKWKGKDRSNSSYNPESRMLQERDGSRSFRELQATKSARLRTQSLSEKPVSARKSSKQRTQSARQIRMKTHERRHKSGRATATQGTDNVEKTLSNDSDTRNHRVAQVNDGGTE